LWSQTGSKNVQVETPPGRHYVGIFKRVVQTDEVKNSQAIARNAVCEQDTLLKFFHCEKVTL